MTHNCHDSSAHSLFCSAQQKHVIHDMIYDMILVLDGLGAFESLCTTENNTLMSCLMRHALHDSRQMFSGVHTQAWLPLLAFGENKPASIALPPCLLPSGEFRHCRTQNAARLHLPFGHCLCGTPRFMIHGRCSGAFTTKHGSLCLPSRKMNPQVLRFPPAFAFGRIPSLPFGH